MLKIFQMLDRIFLPLLAFLGGIYANQKGTRNTFPVWAALVVSVPMVFLNISAMNVMTIIVAGVFGLFAFTGKESHDPLTPVDRWRIFAPMVILMGPSLLCLGRMEGVAMNMLAWMSILAAFVFALVASHRILALQDKPLPLLMKLISPLTMLLHLLLKPVLLFAEAAGEWMMSRWRSTMVWGAWGVGMATVWYPLPADDYISIAGGVLGLIFGVFEFRSRSGEPKSADQWAIYGASILSIGLGVLCPGNMFASFMLFIYATSMSVLSFVVAAYVVSKTVAEEQAERA